jgi:uncharacterized linocin/CFP29 family protein
MANDQVAGPSSPPGQQPPTPHFAPPHDSHPQHHHQQQHDGHQQHNGHTQHHDGQMHGHQHGMHGHTQPGSYGPQSGMHGTGGGHPQMHVPLHHGGHPSQMGTTAHLGDRNKVPWSAEVWARIDRAVHDEIMRARVAAKFLPIQPVHGRITSVPSETVRKDSLDGLTSNASIVATHPTSPKTLTIDEGATLRVNEFWIEFAMTPQQVEHESGDPHQLGHSAAVTLATRGANYLALAEDLIIFQGVNAFETHFFKSNIRFRGAPSDTGLLSFGTKSTQFPSTSPPLHKNQIIDVPTRTSRPPIWGEETFGAVAKGYSHLQQNGHYGPYALVLETTPFADSYAPLPNTLILTADRIKPLMDAGFFGSHTLHPGPETVYTPGATPPPVPSSTGILLSLGGNTFDVVRGLEPTVTFMQIDPNGFWRFRVVERFALRIKDATAIVRLEFDNP